MHCAAVCITRDSSTAFENRNDRITRQPPKSLDNLLDSIYLDTKSIYFVLDIFYTHISQHVVQSVNTRIIKISDQGNIF